MAEKAEIVLSAKDQTAAAFATAKRNFDQLQSSAIGLAARFGTIGVAITSALTGASLKGAIDAADELSKLEQKTGIAIESLSALKYAGQLSDVSIEDLAVGIKKLGNNMAAAAGGSKEATAAFSAVGVAFKTADGALRSSDDVLGDIAERFAGYKDGAAKAALATELFGKNGAALIPFLNSGRKGLGDLKTEAEKLGIVIGGELGKQAEAFNDNLTRLSAAAEGAKVALIGGLLPSLIKISDEFIDARIAYGSFLSGFADTLNGSTAEGGLVKTRGEIEDLKKALVELDRQASSSSFVDQFNSIGTGKSSEKLKEQIALLEKRADFQKRQQARDALAGGDVPETNARLRGAPKKDARTGNKKTDGADNADALLRKQLEGNLKAIQDGLEKERDLFSFQDQRLAELFQHGELSIDQFYDAKAKAQLNYLAEQGKGFDDEIKALRDYQAKASKPQDIQDAQNKINELEAQRAKGLRESGQAAEVAETQRQRAIEQFQKSLQSLDGDLAELTGNTYGSELLRNAERFDQARKLLQGGGEDTGRADELKRLLDLQSQFNESQKQYSRITQAAQTAEELYISQAERTGASRAEVEKTIGGLRQKALGQLDELIAKTEELVAKSNNPDQIAYLDTLRLAREKAFAQADPGLTRFNEQIKTVSDTLAGSIEDALLDGGEKGFKGLEKQLLRLVINDAFTKPLSNSITDALKKVGEGGTGGGFEKLFSGIGNAVSGIFNQKSSQQPTPTGGGGSSIDYLTKLGSFFSSFFHNGGIVGEGGVMRAVNPMVFAGATRYHSGGIAGLKPDEHPAILKRGEEVLRTDDPRHRYNAAGGGSSDRGSPAVVIENHGAEIQQQSSTGADGREQIKLIVRQAVNQTKSELLADFGSGTGPMSSTLKGRGVPMGNAAIRRY